MHRWIVGIDEAGRGPLAGPVAVGVVKVPHDFDWGRIPGVNDSKKLSHKNREAIFMLTEELQKEGALTYSVKMTSAPMIDRIGIVPSVRRSIASALRALAPDTKTTSIKLDGLLSAPEEFIYQETIVGGDGKEKVIGLASIMAKVTRDRYMERLAKKQEAVCYGFDLHKGYGTKAHLDAIRTHGLLEGVHRVSYCRNIQR
ncbi:ribonuclease HII [Candidatus Parcubacteria bacterium]|uniref:Ribonuclease n=1 Tax=Candidatus Kaiserbacteria bacterium CG10_big_fil_rev_8_21_14_0_10_47_16 TaxID=1974608 RepID=A0A2H0UE62_9BACT|nr:ribonuclease HII [Candidatus Parcubacteria bacterium]PIR84718.1 MAG: ribonuclease HII [Candidatus Kaiserbacteria bacterium CG10_big_fil_rev_8_21_14_0_10_47_16]